MAQVIGVRATSQVVTEERIIRQVADEIAMLEPNQAPLVTMLNRLKKRVPVKSPRWEWFEDDYVARWGQNSTATVAASTSSTTVTVVDGTVFLPGDLVTVPPAIDSSAVPEVMRVTAVSGGVLTVVRDVYSDINNEASAVAAINPSVALRIVGNAFEEGAALPSSKTTAPVKRQTFTQIFRTVCDFTKTQVATDVYGAPSGDRAREHRKKLIEHKIQLNSALLFSRPSESLSGGPSGKPIRTTQGLVSAIKTNVTNAGGTLTRKVFEGFSRQAFRYGKEKKLLLAAPILKSAITEWAKDFMLLKPSETKYGISVQQVETAHGVWLLVNDWMLENGVSGQQGFGNMALSLDVDQLRYIYLNNNGENRDTAIHQDVLKDGSDKVVDEILTEGGFAVMNEKYHARLYNINDWS